MKISQEMLKQIDTSQKSVRTAKQDQPSFGSIVQSQTQKMQAAELQRLMSDITVQGDRLARFRSFKDLVKFKRLIKRFLEEAVSNGLDVQKSLSFSYTGSSRNLTLVKEIDEKLIALTEEIMNQEKKTVDLLGLIGEIKGLLVNIYT
ncbi:YaaR family protein [Ornithinibacillus sp. BX22]|uniref:YaaR family protein n=1 Tax=Ornithinibacillus hominis TaxID=2763055 RepID=A0A923L8J5_9BACI|nr:YaaR family protein [Ornithinibacillus hominis]MBC5638384.1 YaaR family protein [Ornithinibacillus hominis]